MSARRSILSLLALSSILTPALGCKGDDPSNLEQMAKQPEVTKPEVTKPTEPTPDPSDDPPAFEQDIPDLPETKLPVDADGLPIPAFAGPAKLLSPGADDKRVELRLALADAARYRITTIGMLKLPLFEKPVGFAREEELRLADCAGEGFDRSCLVTHSYRNFEAEPPTGEALEKDEALVAELETSHRIDASGLRSSETAIAGTVENPAAQALWQVHRFYCVRLPNEAVGVGATWRDTCRNREGGSIVTRELVWRLAKLEDTPDGQRAELEYAGRVRRIAPGGEVQSGEVKGVLYFWVDAGEPHLMRERIAFILDADKRLSTGTDLRYQFAKVGEKDELIRTDGKPFEDSPTAINDTRSVPLGDTRDAEHPGPTPAPN